ncbi:MAG: helix-turn-helix domain-containing protein [Micromonosporaceae bacterium]|nr:helix-turn-helix domain-containing protein [Micromonosporaceae bacterium]
MTASSPCATARETLWTIDEAAAFLRVPSATLYQWRHRRTGPLAAKVGRHLRYDPAKVRAWLSEQEQHHAR